MNQTIFKRRYCCTGVGTLAALLMTCAATASQPLTTPMPPAPGQMVKTSAAQTHLNCTGAGAPTVILEAGLGGNSLEWAPVQRLLTGQVRVCSYDRPGYGWSGITENPRNARTIARELHQLLVQSGESGPFILVGHSFGGHIVRLYANEFQSDVSGIVLVDASHEALFDILGGGQSTMLITIKAPKIHQPWIPRNIPRELHALFYRFAMQSKTSTTIQNETFHFRRSAAEVSWHPELPNVPVTVISRGFEKSTRDKKTGEIARQWADMQRDLHRRLSDGQHVIASGSGHFPHLDQPQLVSDAIFKLVQAAQENQRM